MHRQTRAELRLHTVTSADISVISPRKLVQEAERKGIQAVAVTDRNSVQSFFDVAWWWKKCAKTLKVIYGAEIPHQTGGYVTVLVKDQQGLPPLYRRISGREINADQRQHLLYGAQDGSPLHRAVAKEASAPVLQRLAEEYDYIELRTSNFFSCDRELNRKLYLLGKTLGKPVVAVGNCHYLNSNQRIAKQVLDVVRQQAVETEETPLLTAEEMLERYAYLGEEAAYEVVITNPNRLAEQIGMVDPAEGADRCVALTDTRETVRRLCEERLSSLYGEQPLIRQRLEQELERLGENESMLLLCHDLVTPLREQGGLVGLRGTGSAILMAWLLGISDINPLPAHYRCPECRYTEFAEAASGFDLPEKACPHCGKPMAADGQDIPYESCLGPDGEGAVDLDLNMSETMRWKAWNFLEDYLGQGRLAAAGSVSLYTDRVAQAYTQVYADLTGDAVSGAWLTELICGVKRCDGTHPVGILMLPKGMEWEEITPLRFCDEGACSRATHFDFHWLEGKLPRLDIMAVDWYDRLQALFAATGAKISDIDFRDRRVYALFQELDTCGVPVLSSVPAREMLASCDSLDFSCLVKICCMDCGTNVWRANAQTLLPEHPFRELISNREDVLQTLLRWGADRKTAYAAMNATRKGCFGSNRALKGKLGQLGIPEWYLASMEKIGYLFPKGHGAHYAKLAYMAAWFKVYYPDAFYGVLLKHMDGYVGCSLCQLEARQEKLDPEDYEQSRELEDIRFVLEAHRRGYARRTEGIS